MKFNKPSRVRGVKCSRVGFTLVELLVAVALLAVLVPVIYQALQVSTLAGEVSQRKTLAARIAEEKLNEAIVTGQMQSAQRGTELVGPFQFQWSLKDEPWSQLGNQAAISTSSNSVNQAVVNSTIIHQVSVEVTYTAQNRNYSVRLSTLANVSNQ
jgi:type II secretion system protein I